ncbi:MAG: recombinase family protein [Desulfomonile sp.]|nr:recombinase family protein [Desulfomonile sp.]
MNAFGYCRVSSQDQLDGTSLTAQEEQIRAYAKLKGLEIGAMFVDGAVSGSVPLAKRPEGGKLVEALERGEACALVVTKLDRGFRSASDCLVNVEAWTAAGISLHILNLGGQTIDTSTPTGKFFITIMAGAAELERNMIRERCNEGRRARRAQGCRLGEVPFGFSLASDGKTLVESGEEQKAIRLSLRLKRQGHSAAAIARELNRRGIPTKKGAEWTHVQVTRLLKRAV